MDCESLIVPLLPVLLLVGHEVGGVVVEEGPDEHARGRHNCTSGILLESLQRLLVEDGVDCGGGGGGGAQPVPQQLVHGVELGLRLGVELVDLAAVLWGAIQLNIG